jgi:DNA-binding beta-propeller fold protein YncE
MKKIKITLLFLTSIVLLSACSKSTNTNNNVSLGSFYVTANTPSKLVQVSLRGGNELSSITVNSFGQGNSLILSTGGNIAWVERQNSLISIDLSRGTVTTSTSLGKLPIGIVSNPDQNFIYSVDNLTSTYYEVNATTGEVAKTLNIQIPAGSIAISPDGKYIAVASLGPANSTEGVEIIDPLDSQILGVIQVGNQPINQMVFGALDELWVLETPPSNKNSLLYPVNLANQKAGIPIQLGSVATAMAINATGTVLYIGYQLAGQIQAVNLINDSIESTLQLKGQVQDLVLSADNQSAYITTMYPNQIIPLNLSTFSELNPINLQFAPNSLALTNSNTAWVEDPAPSGSLTVYNPSNLSTTADYQVGANPIVVTGKPDQGTWIVNQADSTVSYLNNAKLSKPQNVCLDPLSAQEAPAGSDLYVLCQNAGTPGQVEKVTPDLVSPPVNVGQGASFISVSQNGNILVVANTLSNDLSILSASNLSTLATVKLPLAPDSILITPDSRTAYVTGSNSTNIVAVNLENYTVKTTIAVQEDPSMFMSPDGSTLWVLNRASQTIQEVSTDSNTVTKTMPFVGNPVDASIAPDGSYVIISDDVGGKIWELSAASGKFTRDVSVTSSPEFVAINSSGQYCAEMDTISQKLVLLSCPSLTTIESVTISQGSTDLAATLPPKILSSESTSQL